MVDTGERSGRKPREFVQFVRDLTPLSVVEQHHVIVALRHGVQRVEGSNHFAPTKIKQLGRPEWATSTPYGEESRIGDYHAVLTLSISLGENDLDVQLELDGDLFVWDSQKADNNFRKHDVKFEEAATVFSDPLFIIEDSSRNDEARDAAIGFDATGRLLYVVHVEVEDVCIRIVSARRADRNEELRYAD